MSPITLLILSVFLSIFIIIYTYFKWIYNYWKNRNVPCLPPTIPFGSFTNKKKHIGVQLGEFYKEMKKKGHRYAGFYFFDSPVFFPTDLELVKNILISDFQYFANRGGFINKNDPFSASLFVLEDERWKNLRGKLTPAFTTGKLKEMLEPLMKCGESFIEAINGNTKEIDIRELTARYMMDTTGSIGFGVDCNTFKDPNSELRSYGLKAIENSFNFKIFLTLIFPKLSKLFNVHIFDSNVGDYFLKMFEKTFTHRKKNNVRRFDFLQILIDLENEGKLTMQEFHSQAMVFFIGGFETISNTITFGLYELSKNQHIQDEVRKEIKEILRKYNGELNYQALNEMKYLEMVVQETLRKYPVSPILNRVCTKDYPIPKSNLVLEKGTKVFIPVFGIQYDSEYFPEPEKFDPNRFSENNKGNIPQCTALTFGQGPRTCIGLRFGHLQVKVCLATIIKHFKISLNSKTPKKINFHPTLFFLSNLEKIYLDAEKINL